MKSNVKFLKFLISFIAFMSACPGTTGAKDNFMTEVISISGLSSEWKSLSFHKPFTEPVIVCSGISNNNTSPVTACIRNIRKKSFEVRLRSLNHKTIVPENLNVYIFERGHWALAEDQKGEALTIDADQFHENVFGKLMGNVNLCNRYKNPVVVSTVIENNNSVPLTTSIYNLSESSFYLQLNHPSGTSPAPKDVNILVSEKGFWPLEDGQMVESRLLGENTSN